MMLQKTYHELLSHYTDDECLISELWGEVAKYYGCRTRYYHTLQHLDHCLAQLILLKDAIQNWHAILLAMYYHDIIYNSLRSDNEDKSALLAEERLLALSVPLDTIELCQKHILATKMHMATSDVDTQYFTDIDLSILGQDWATYLVYCQNVRKEYSIYPDCVYNAGRKKVLKHFLMMDKIFKSDVFFQQLENQAKHNLQQELIGLSGI